MARPAAEADRPPTPPPAAGPETKPDDQRRVTTWWTDAKDGMTGRVRDYTRGPIAPALVALSVPMVLEMFMQAVFEVADVWFVARLGPAPVAAVGLSAALVVLVFAVSIGLSMAVQAIVARRIGEGDPDGAAAAVVQAVGLGILISTVVAVVGVVEADTLLRLMGAEDDVVEAGRGYLQVLMGSNGTIMLLFLFNAVFRGTGEASHSMRVLWIANLLNVVLDPIFIFGFGPVPAMGTTGAAIATTMGRLVGITLQIYLLTRGRTRLRFSRAGFRLQADIMRRLMTVAWPAVVQFLVGTASFVALTRIVAMYGSDALAGFTVAQRILVFVVLPALGLGNAAATMVGQNLGAGFPDRADASVRLSSRAALVIMGIGGAATLLVAEPLIRLFTHDPGVVSAGTLCLRVIAFGFPLRAVVLTLIQSFNGAGDTTTPTWINLVAYWIVQIPAALLLARTADLGPVGIYLAIVLSQAMAAWIAWVMFVRGKWRAKVV